MQSRQEISETLTDYLEEMFEISRSDITPDARLYEDLDLDSIDAVDLIVKLQEITGKRIPPDAFRAARTVNDVIDCVEGLFAAEPG